MCLELKYCGHVKRQIISNLKQCTFTRRCRIFVIFLTAYETAADRPRQIRVSQTDGISRRRLSRTSVLVLIRPIHHVIDRLKPLTKQHLRPFVSLTVSSVLCWPSWNCSGVSHSRKKESGCVSVNR